MSNNGRAAALMEDMETWNQEEAEKTNVKELEKFLDGMDEKERRMVETMARNIPKNLSPLEYEQELNWKRQQARELINEEISQRYR